MNKTVNKFILACGKFIPGIHLKEPGFTYCACGTFTKSNEIIQTFKETGDSRYTYQKKIR